MTSTSAKIVYILNRTIETNQKTFFLFFLLIFGHPASSRRLINQWRSKKSVMWVKIEFYESVNHVLHTFDVSVSFISGLCSDDMIHWTLAAYFHFHFRMKYIWAFWAKSFSHHCHQRLDLSTIIIIKYCFLAEILLLLVVFRL